MEDLIKIGLSAIRNGDYTPRNDAETKRRFGIDSVWCDKTNLMGIITTKGEEVLPCVFDSVSIHLDFCIEAVFKGAQFDFCGIHVEKGVRSFTTLSTTAKRVRYSAGRRKMKTAKCLKI